MKYRWQGRPFIVMEEDKGSGGGGGGAPDPSALLESFKQKHSGDVSAALLTVVQENWRYREERRELKRQLAESKVPDGAKILSSDEAKELEAYRALGKPEDLKAKVEKAVDLEQRVTQAERQQLLDEAAELSGYKPSVLRGLAGELPVSLKEHTVDEDGKKVKQKVAYVKDGETEIPLTEYATSKWSDFMPALEAKAGGPDNKPDGKQYVRQPGKDGGGPDDIVEAKLQEFEKRRSEKTNPLLASKA